MFTPIPRQVPLEYCTHVITYISIFQSSHTNQIWSIRTYSNMCKNLFTVLFYKYKSWHFVLDTVFIQKEVTAKKQIEGSVNFWTNNDAKTTFIFALIRNKNNYCNNNYLIQSKIVRTVLYCIVLYWLVRKL